MGLGPGVHDLVSCGKAPVQALATKDGSHSRLLWARTAAGPGSLSPQRSPEAGALLSFEAPWAGRQPVHSRVPAGLGWTEGLLGGGLREPLLARPPLSASASE